MKKFPFRMLFLCFACTSGTAFAQQTPQEIQKKDVEVTKYTVMERFGPELMPSVQERMALKKEHRAEMNRRREILDTLDISERKREKLLSDLLKEPFSPRLTRTLAELEFADETN